VLLPWERLLWSSRPWHLDRRLAGERYLLTDFRLLCITRHTTAELALDDIGEIHRTESSVDRLLGVSTITAHPSAGGAPLTLPEDRRVAELRREFPELDGVVRNQMDLDHEPAVRRGGQLAALLELLAGDPRAPREADAVRSALAWEPRQPSLDLRGTVAGFIGILIAIVAVAIGLHGTTVTATYAADDALAPGGEKRSEADIIRLEVEVMPWARVTFGRLKGGADRVTCETCHGAHARARAWKMPAVAALPQPDIRERGWEIYQTNIDAQMRNAIYGYLAESDNQTKAGYMREVVVPGMSRLLHRPAYDFSQSYEYNRSRRAWAASLPSGPVTTDYDRSVVVPARVPSRALLSSWSAHDWRGGVCVDDLAILERLVVKTANSTYDIVLLAPDQARILVRGGAFFPVFTPARLAGSSLGGAF
jgi:hypothetical protein